MRSYEVGWTPADYKQACLLVSLEYGLNCTEAGEIVSSCLGDFVGNFLPRDQRPRNPQEFMQYMNHLELIGENKRDAGSNWREFNV